MPSRGSSTSVAFTAFLRVRRAWQEVFSLTESKVELLKAEKMQWVVPVLDGLWRGRGSQFGHQDPHDVEQEDEINLWENKSNAAHSED